MGAVVGVGTIVAVGIGVAVGKGTGVDVGAGVGLGAIVGVGTNVGAGVGANGSGSRVEAISTVAIGVPVGRMGWLESLDADSESTATWDAMTGTVGSGVGVGSGVAVGTGMGVAVAWATMGDSSPTGEPD